MMAPWSLFSGGGRCQEAIHGGMGGYGANSSGKRLRISA